MNYIGRSGANALYVFDDNGVVVDTTKNVIVELGPAEALIASAGWDLDIAVPPQTEEIATAALTNLDIQVFSDNDRMYTIPDAVKSEAKRALKWRAEENRGGTPVGMNTARTLAKGGQIGIKKLRHVAKYFPRHEVDKKGKGWKPAEEGYPSNGRIAWALWGGDAARRWASAIVEREDKKAVTAGLFEAYYGEDRVDHKSFSSMGEYQPDFYARVRLDGTGIDRLYKVEEDGSCCFWDDGAWENLGNVEHDFLTYDKTLDDAYDKAQKIHVGIDRESAIAISAMLDSEPFENVTLQKINFDETDLFEKAIPEMDWQLLDQLSIDDVPEEDSWDEDGLMASATEFAEESVTLDSTTQSDGVYTPEERAENAEAQLRGADGTFAKMGGEVVIGGNADYTGTITAINADTQEASVQLANGESVNVPVNLTEPLETFEPVSTASFPESNLDFSGILGEPRTPIDEPLAHLPGRLPPLTGADTNLLVNDWQGYVADQRLAPDYTGDPLPPFVPKDPPSYESVMGQYWTGAFNPDGSAKPGWNPAVAQNVYNEPLLRDWLDTKYANASGEEGYHNRGWYTPRNDSRIPVEGKKTREEVNSREWRNRMDSNWDPVNFSILAAAETSGFDPSTSDVAPMYLAIVGKDDPQAVMDLICLVPASKDSATAAAYKREPGKWVRDDRTLNDLNSPTPPPVVVLDNNDLSEVTKQIDGEVITASAQLNAAVALSNNTIIAALMAAGGADRNRGNAEKLRRYWTVGEGGLKIRWGTPGDWTRCTKQLSKYMGERSKGYCALRHKEMNGVWPGDKKNIGKKKSLTSSAEVTEVVEEPNGLKTEETIISEFTLRARAEAAKSRMVGRAGVVPSEHGAFFTIPLVIPEGIETGDGRIFDGGAITMRDLPLPLLWQIKTGSGHDGSVVVGQITHMERVDGGIGNAYGVFDTGSFGKEAERLVRHGFIRGVSADMDKFEADEEEVESDAGDSEHIESGRIKVSNARIMAVTIVPKPAFQECFIQIIDNGSEIQEEEVLPDGVYVDGVNPLDASALVACGMVAGVIPLEPPTEWFDNPKLNKPTPLTVGDDGRVYGHVAAWNVDHIGMNYGTRPPRSRSKYGYFHTGVVRTSEGKDIPVGQLTLAGGHAGLEASAQEAVRHYDDTASAFADVHAGEDAYGIWVAGALRPGTTPEQIRAARASAPSGDWRPIKGHLELVAVCQVNVPGFPIARARVASGQVMALVAAGASTLAQLKHDPLAELNNKIDSLAAIQNQPIVDAAEEAKARFASMTFDIHAAKMAELAAKVKVTKDEMESDWEYMVQMMDENPEQEMAVVPRRERERLAKEGKALKDGSYPIRNVADLKKAVQAYGRSKPGSRGAVRKHIMKRARALDKPELIPEKWSTASNIEDFSIDMRERAEFAAESANLGALFSESALVAAGDEVEDDLVDLTPEEVEALKREKMARDSKEDDARPKYTPETQPRDDYGKYRKVLARLKSDLGVAGLNKVIEKVEEAENLVNGGDYEQSAKSSAELMDLIGRLDTKALNPEALENVRLSAGKLGEVIANLPFAFGEASQKLRFSDVPPALQDLMKDMITKVEEKIGEEDAAVATAELKSFMSGSDYYNQSEISSQMSKLLRLLT